MQPSVAGSWVEGMIAATHEETLRRLALHDEGCIQSVLGIRLDNDEAGGLDPKAHALVRLGGLVALGGSSVSYHWAASPFPRSPWRSAMTSSRHSRGWIVTRGGDARKVDVVCGRVHAGGRLALGRPGWRRPPHA